MEKIITLLILGILVLSFVVVGYYLDKSQQENKEYQGPVPEGYDEEYFRETGITKPLEDNKNG